MGFGRSWCGSKSPVSEQSSSRSSARDGLRPGQGPRRPSAAELPAKPLKGEDARGVGSSARKKLPSRVYLSIEGLEGGPRAGTPWGRMLRLTLTLM